MVKTRAQLRKERIGEPWSRVESAQDVFYNILSRIPVKSIWKFKTVNKYWHRSISNKYFAEQQIKQSRKKNTSFVISRVQYASVMLYSVDVESFELFSLNITYPCGMSIEKSTRMISSFNGLICCLNEISSGQDVVSRNYDLQIWICNPGTGESLLLPKGTISFNFPPIVGVAYDASDISDYRVFRIYHCVESTYHCEVYSSSRGSWKYIGPVPPINRLLDTGHHVFVGGKIYWLVSLDEILSVDFEERFEVIDFPKYGDDLPYEHKRLPYERKRKQGTHLFILRGCLALFVMHVTYMVIWTWKAKGEKYGWVFECRDSIPQHRIFLTVTSIKNKILCMTQTHWYTYDMVTKFWNRERVPLIPSLIPAVFPFYESIMPCTGGVRL